MHTKITLSLLVCSFLLLSGCKSLFESKDKGVEQLNSLENRWADALTLASSTSRFALAQPISQLQEIKRDLLNTEVSECLNPARKDLNMYMDQHINNFLKFMTKDNNIQVQANPELINYLAIKAKCTDEKANTNPYLVAEAKFIEERLKIEAQEREQEEAERKVIVEKIAKEKGINPLEVTAEDIATAEKITAEKAAAAAREKEDAKIRAEAEKAAIEATRDPYAYE